VVKKIKMEKHQIKSQLIGSCKKMTMVLVCLLQCSYGLKAQTTNIEAVTKYWELTDALKRGAPLTDAKWDAFMAIEGNKTYAASEFDAAQLARYRKAIELVYLPANDSLLKVKLAANDWFCLLAKRYKDEEQHLKVYLADTVQQPAYFGQAYQFVYDYLPKKFQRPLTNLTLYYNCLSNDAISVEKGLYFSLLSVINNAQTKQGTLEAHELHHRLRDEIDIYKNQEPRNLGLCWAIRSIPNEGIADMIDKPWEKPVDIADWLIDPAPETIRKIDSCITVLASNTNATQSERTYRDLLKRTSGHMPGFYMAQVIVRNGYKKQMVAQSTNPFAFFFLYQNAAAKDAAHPPLFSATSITYLKQLALRSRKSN
jgi:hypothetical protein